MRSARVRVMENVSEGRVIVTEELVRTHEEGMRTKKQVL
jgi:hypothetical protein